MRSRHVQPRIEVLEDRLLLTRVTTLQDHINGSLRAAILSTTSGGTIDFASGLTGTIELTGEALTLDKNLTISGPGPGVITVSGNNALEVFNIESSRRVTISGLTIANGRAASGGGITNAGTLTLNGCVVLGNTATAGSGDSLGAGIFNSGVVTLTNCLVINNIAVGGNGTTGTRSLGGGIYNQGTVTLSSSTVANNTARGGDAFGLTAGAGLGGGIYNSGSVTAINSTITTNTAVGGNSTGPIGQGGSADGGGIASTGALATISVTVTANHSVPGTGGGGNGTARGGGLSLGSATSMRNTIVALDTAPNGAPDVEGGAGIAVANLIGDGTGSAGIINGVNGNQVGTSGNPINPRLGVLRANGGPTPTLALLPGSPAIDRGDNASSPGSVDQRGLPRIINNVIDIGAYELQPIVPIFAVGGAPGRVEVHRSADGALITSFNPYGLFAGPVTVAVGDINGDGFPDLVTGAGAGNPHVKVFDGAAFANGTFDPNHPDGSLLAQWLAFPPGFNVGVNVAVGDISRNGFPDVVTGTTTGNPEVRVFSGRDIASGQFDPNGRSLLSDFFAYDLGFNVGANVAVGDINHDGFPDVITGATAGNPHVKVFSGQDIAAGSNAPTVLASFFAYGLGFGVGAFVAAGDVNGDGFTDLITGASTGNPDVHVYDGQAFVNGTFDNNNPDASLLSHFFAYESGQDTGVAVAAAQFEGAGTPFDILTGPTTTSPLGTPVFRVVRGLSSGIRPPAVYEAEATTISGGLFVGA
jgi:hypothetical protein